MCGPLLIPLAVAAISAVGTGVAAHMSSIAQGQQADKAAQEQQSAQQAQTDAVKAAGTAQKATPADTSNVNAGGTPAAAGVNSGPASTLLTGSGGVSGSALNLGGASGLGSNTLLGS